MTAVDPFGLPPEEAQRWFREKGYAYSFDWRDMWGPAHARAFSVAKATQLDVLADLRDGVDKAISSGITLAEFRKQLKPMLQERGWWGEKEVVDPKTGEKTLVQLGSASRLRTIYETNLRQAQAAGRWERAERTKTARPWARYVAVLDGHERDAHKAWHGTVLPLDDPFWNTHAPPNGWGCRCKLQILSDRDLSRYGYKPSVSAPPVDMVGYVNERTGQRLQVPKGIDPGFDYNPGKVPRGFTPPDNAPELEGIRTFRDEGLPSTKEIIEKGGLPAAVDRWHDVKDMTDATTRWKLLFGGESADVADPEGVQVTFTTLALRHMWDSGDKIRASFVPRAKQAVESPTEIWLTPHRLKDGRVVIRKRYVGIYDGSPPGMIVIVQRNDDGNAFWTAYPARKNVDVKRSGYLTYPRRDDAAELAAAREVAEDDERDPDEPEGVP